ncbi:MAG: hypothetical protein HFE04_00890 [Bacilli bacterium]|nr:hypothetical protein [Bacilli bacterium]
MQKFNVGFSKLDSIFNGLELGSVVLIGGRNNSGKTTILNNFMVSMDEIYKFVSYYAPIEIDQKIFVSVLEKMAINIYDSNIYITDYLDGVEDLEEVLIDNEHIKFVFIDYLELLNVNKYSCKLDSETVFKRLRGLALQYNVLIFVNSLISNRFLLNGQKVTLDSFIDKEFAKDADVILGVWKDIDNDSVINVSVLKNRFGSVGSVNFLLDDKTNKIIEFTI